MITGNAAGKGSELKVTPSSLENARYRVQLNGDGDVSSIFDKSLRKELLATPIRLALSTDSPKFWPAWNMDFDQEQAAPRAFVSGPAKIRIKESGPVRIALEVTREGEGVQPMCRQSAWPRVMPATASSLPTASTGAARRRT